MNLRNLSQEELIKMINENDKKIEALTEQLNWYSQQIKLQQKKLFGSSSEKTVLPDQISLFDEIELESTPIKQEPELEEITYRRKRKSRQRGIDISSLPVKKVIHDIDNKSCPECGALLRKIGENKRKELVYHPARYEVIEHIQYVYTCDRCDREVVQSPIYKAPMKEPVIYKSFASPSLLSYIIDNKFNKALPLYRQEVMFNQMGLKLSRQTMICLYTGIRLGEICALTWDDIDLENRRIEINKTIHRINEKGKSYTIIGTPKTVHSQRFIPIHPQLYHFLLDRQQRSGYILTGTNKYLDPRSYQYYFKKTLAFLNIQDYKFHILRHTFATKCVQCQIDVKSLSEILGHSSVTITLNTYVHSSFEMKKTEMVKYKLF